MRLIGVAWFVFVLTGLWTALGQAAEGAATQTVQEPLEVVAQK